MKYLVVEDEDVSLEETKAVIASCDPMAETAIATNRDQAFELLKTDEFDLIICDLKIPPVADDLDAREDHGLAVHARAQELCPGTPLIFLTGKATPTNVQRQLSHGSVADYYGMKSAPMVQLAVKDSRRAEIAYIADMVAGLELLETCTADGLEVDEPRELLRRAALVYARRLGAVKLRLKLLSGYSEAEVASVTFELPNGQTRAVLVKLQERTDALSEIQHYDLHVPNKLRAGYYAPSISPIAEYGLRKKVALYFSLARGTKSLFRVAQDDPELAAQIVRRMEVDHAAWTREQHKTEVQVGGLRRARISNEDPRSSDLLATHWSSRVEAVIIELDVCIEHGDLHGSNILVDPMARPVLIDYADVDLASAALDPLTLEMSFLFHGDSPMQQDRIPLRQLRSWAEIDEYSLESPYAPVLRACRAWSMRVAPAPTVYATAYVHAVRQLKYPDVVNERALAIARSAGEALLDSI